jgi:hypothetical protein
MPPLRNLRDNKAPGMDFIQAELVKHAGIEYTKYLHQLIIKIWINEISLIYYSRDLPPVWKMSSVTTTVYSTSEDPQVIRSLTYVKCLRNVTNLELKHITSS